jgi:predicted outer membrane repeat protein
MASTCLGSTNQQQKQQQQQNRHTSFSSLSSLLASSSSSTSSSFGTTGVISPFPVLLSHNLFLNNKGGSCVCTQQTVQSVIFTGNTFSHNSAPSYGGAISVLIPSNPLFRFPLVYSALVFTDNNYFFSSSASLGAAIFIDAFSLSSSIYFIDLHSYDGRIPKLIMENNQASISGGAVYWLVSAPAVFPGLSYFSLLNNTAMSGNDFASGLSPLLFIFIFFSHFIFFSLFFFSSFFYHFV